jgi:hypothetical protein
MESLAYGWQEGIAILGVFVYDDGYCLSKAGNQKFNERSLQWCDS